MSDLVRPETLKPFAFAFSPDGSLLATGTGTGVIAIYCTDNFAEDCHAFPRARMERARCIAIHPDAS